ncbi:hypothetical protein HHI36_014208 [Cryptolaemus montrouzieri]|uniref:RGS domain-containing protein n=1 Tax=Cryptolaemus montrouzieri TaxID=559131 RepID=A0ABD2N242_9CUCU
MGKQPGRKQNGSRGLRHGADMKRHAVYMEKTCPCNNSMDIRIRKLKSFLLPFKCTSKVHRREEGFETCEVNLSPFPIRPYWKTLIKAYEKLECQEERMKQARDIYDNFIMKELLARTHDYSKECLQHVQRHLIKNDVPPTLFEPYIEEIYNQLRDEPFKNF